MSDLLPADTPGTMREPDRRPRFHTVREVAELLRVDATTIYRAIRDDEFPAVKIRGRFIVPAQVIDALAFEAVQTRHRVDVADYSLHRDSWPTRPRLR